MTVDKQTTKLGRKLTTSLRNHLEAELPTLYAGPRRPVARQLEKVGVPAAALAADCPCTLDRVVDPECYPDHAHRLSEPRP